MKAFGQAWQDAYNRADIAGLMALYADEVAIVNPQDGSSQTVTKQQIEAQFVREFQEADRHIVINGETAEALSDGKVRVTGKFTFTITNKTTGEKSTFPGSYDHMVLKAGNAWKLCQMKN